MFALLHGPGKDLEARMTEKQLRAIEKILGITHADVEEEDAAVGEMALVLPWGVWHATYRRFDGLPVAEVYAIQVDIPALDARAGDCLVWTAMPEELRAQARGRVHPVLRSQHVLLAGEVERGAVRFVGGTWDKSCEQLARDLRDRRRHRGSGSWCWIIRPWHCVSDPVRADTDDAALFELIHSAGGRMPEEPGTEAKED